MTDAQALFAKVYENEQGAAGGAGPDMSGMGANMGGGAGNAGSSGDNGGDDVVDGDYREV